MLAIIGLESVSNCIFQNANSYKGVNIFGNCIAPKMLADQLFKNASNYMFWNIDNYKFQEVGNYNQQKRWQL